jgi:hypothetical protein
MKKWTPRVRQKPPNNEVSDPVVLARINLVKAVFDQGLAKWQKADDGTYRFTGELDLTSLPSNPSALAGGSENFIRTTFTALGLKPMVLQLREANGQYRFDLRINGGSYVNLRLLIQEPNRDAVLQEKLQLAQAPDLP